MSIERALAVPGVRAADLIELTKPRISLMVGLTAAAGFLLASGNVVDWPALLRAVLGTTALAAGASALNQVLERDTDARMRRTASRPLPAGRLEPEVAGLFGVLLAASGMLYLALAVNGLTALVGAATLVAYVFVYTPMKRVSALATIIGAVPGAAPPVMGWTAARNEIELGAWLLFCLLFFWQLPHFLAIAWLYRADYARAGFPMLTVIDPQGTRAGRQALVYGAALLPVSLMPAAIGLAGSTYFFGALLLGLAFLAAAALFAREPATPSARRLLLVSVLYLPAVLAVLVLDRLAG